MNARKSASVVLLTIGASILVPRLIAPTENQTTSLNDIANVSVEQQPKNAAGRVSTGVDTDQSAENTAADPVARGERENEDALSIISKAGHKCTSVVSVVHEGDSALATCDDGEDYKLSRVTISGHTNAFAMKCSAAAAAGVPC